MNNTVDDFYSSSQGDLPPAGTLLRIDDYRGPHPEELTVKRILFSSTYSTGEPTIASGFVALPTSYLASGSTSPLPLVLWEHGTNGLESMCALSAGPAALDPQAFPAVDGIVEKQWAIVAPDFMSHTQPNRSPYLVGEGQAQFALDAVRAARSLNAALELAHSEGATQEINFTRETVVWGHSQGGNAALWTSQFAASYAPEIHIAGTAALSPAALPLELGLHLTSESASAAVGIVVSYVLGSYSAAYPDVDPNDHVAHNALPIYGGFKSRCTNGAAAGSILTALALQQQSNDVFHNFGADTSLGKHLARNEPTGPFPSPLFIGWGSKDEVIASSLQNQYVEKLCASGTTSLTVHEYPERTHMDVLHADSDLPADLISWTDAVFSGAPSEPDSSACN